MHSPKALLNTYWGHKNFRPHQEEIIDKVLAGKDVLAILPTGAGKSLCYQLPALSLEGITLVISPLIALMHDQVAQLTARDIKAMAFVNDPKRSIEQQLDNSQYGNFKLVYCAPERLLQTAFLNRLIKLPIERIAIDEAHCISEWGHDFRPAYRKIARLREQLPHVPIIALTASATPPVQEDIVQNLQLKIDRPDLASFKRPNLQYHVIETENKIGQLFQQLSRTQVAIVYCWTRQETEEIALQLQQLGLAVNYFHGGLNNDEKQQRLEAWQTEKTPIMVATTAFGMGIDKANVDRVFHLTLPDSLENYYQQSGRAGRDGNEAQAVLLVHPGEHAQIQKRIAQETLDKEFVEKTFKALCNYLQIPIGEGADCAYQLSLQHFCQTYKLPMSKTLACLQWMDQSGIFGLQQKNTSGLRFSVDVSPEVFRQTSSLNPSAVGLVQYLTRNFHQLYQTEHLLFWDQILPQFQQPKEKILAALDELQKRGNLHYTLLATDLQLHWQVPREDQYTLNPLLAQLKKRNSLKQQKWAAVLDYAFTANNCKQQELLHYFGESNTSPCGICSVCSTTQKTQTPQQTNRQLLDVLKKGPQTLREISFALDCKESVLLETLHELASNQQITRTDDNKWQRA